MFNVMRYGLRPPIDTSGKDIAKALKAQDELLAAAINLLEFGMCCDCDDVTDEGCEWCKRAMRLERAVKDVQKPKGY